MKKFFLILFSCLVVCLCACRHRHYQSLHSKKASHTPHGYYVLTIQGIECRQCVLAALRSLLRVPGVADIVCHCTHKDYEHAWFSCRLNMGTMIPLTLMQHRLTEHDLILASIQGSFSGVVMDDKLSIAGLNQPVSLTGAAQALQQVFAEAKASPDKRAHVSGFLDVRTNKLRI